MVNLFLSRLNHKDRTFKSQKQPKKVILHFGIGERTSEFNDGNFWIRNDSILKLHSEKHLKPTMKHHANPLTVFISKKIFCGVGLLILGGVAPLGAATIYIDFGDSTTQMPSPNSGTSWNNLNQTQTSSLSGGATGSNISLVDSLNASTGITLTVTDLFQAANTNGTTTPTTGVAAFNFSNLSRDSLYVQTGNLTAGFNFSGFKSGFTYRFTMFASRAGVSDNRSAAYTLTGAMTQTVTLDASNNTSNVVATGFLAPNGSNNISFSMARATSNNNTSGFAYLGGMQIEEIPEPSTYLMLLGGTGALALLRRRSAKA